MVDVMPHPEREEMLSCSLANALGLASSLIEISYWRAGADYGVYRVLLPDSPEGVLRVPHREEMDTAYDGVVDFRRVLERELAVHDALERHRIAAPRVLGSDTSRLDVPWSWILTEYVAHEPITSLSESQSRELGAIARRIHAIPGSDVHGPVLGGAQFRSFMRERFLLRLGNLSESAVVPGDPAAWLEAFDELTSGYDPAGGRLLHMDLRAENVCIAGGKIVAVLDMTNAMVGDPRCEIGRALAYGVATDDFLAGTELCHTAPAAIRSLRCTRLTRPPCSRS